MFINANSQTKQGVARKLPTVKHHMAKPLLCDSPMTALNGSNSLAGSMTLCGCLMDEVDDD